MIYILHKNHTSWIQIVKKPPTSIFTLIADKHNFPIKNQNLLKIHKITKHQHKIEVKKYEKYLPR